MTIYFGEETKDPVAEVIAVVLTAPPAITAIIAKAEAAHDCSGSILTTHSGFEFSAFDCEHPGLPV